MSSQKSSSSLNMTTGKPAFLLLRFSIPLILGNIIQQLYGLGDMITVGRVLGDSSIAAIGTTGCIWGVMFAIASGFTGGLTILTTQRFGAKDYDGMRNSMVHATVLSLTVAFIVTLFSVLFCKSMLSLLRTPPELIDDAETYLKILFYGTPLMILYNLQASFLRSVGNSKVPLYFLIFSCVVNLSCDILFLTQFGWGIAGVAWATNF